MQRPCVRAALRAIACGGVLLVMAGQTQAVNKCTLASGDVVYQDATCPSGVTKSQPVKTWSNTPGDSSGGDGWTFERIADDMTGRVTCRAVSDTVTGRFDRYRPTHVALVLLVSANRESLVIRSDEDSFHNDLQGMGIKVDDGPFIPVSEKFGQHVAGPSGALEAAAIAALSTGRASRLRLRFWPYDQLHDTAPISTDGFKQAMDQARRCARK